MPEYLSPGVYVEEQDSGSKPIEGVSTSTTGFVGVTERGPANVPMLLTSFSDFKRTFGGYLPIGDYSDLSQRPHCYTPHAVEGFFVNGGKRAYVVRVTTDGATRADRRLFLDDPQAANPPPTVLLRAAEEGTGTTLNPPLLYALSTDGLAQFDVIRIGDGSRSEYRKIVTLDPVLRHVSLGLPLQNAHAVGSSISDVTGAAGAVYPLVAAVGAGAVRITVTGGVALTNQLIEVGAAPAAEYVFVLSTVLSGAQAIFTLATPLQRDHAATDTATVLTLGAPAATTQLSVAANGGDSIVYANDLQGVFTATTDLVVIDQGTALQEVRRIGQLSELTLAIPSYEDYPISAVVESVKIGDDDRVVKSNTGSTTVVGLDDVSGLQPGMALAFSNGNAVITAVDNSVVPPTVTLQTALAGAPPQNSAVQVQPRALQVAANAGAVVITLDARIGLAPGDVIRIGVAPNCEYVTVLMPSAPSNAPPDAGNVVIDRPLQQTWPALTDVHRQGAAQVVATVQATYTLLDAPLGSTQLLVADGSGYPTPSTVRVTLPSGDQHIHLVTAVTAAHPHSIELDTALTRSHAAGVPVVEREPLFIVRALDKGAWGNRVLVTSADEPVGLLARAEVIAATPSPGPGLPSTLRLTTVTGIEPGTILQLNDPTDSTQVGDLLKVRQIDKSANNLVMLDPPGLSSTQIAAFTAAATAGQRLIVHSREFRMQVLLLSPPNPAIPIRNDNLLDQELFRQLSMDHRHSHYFEQVIGATFDDGASVDDLGKPLRRSDRRSEGTSNYIRVQDLATTDADRERIRLGPESLVDVLPSTLTRPARFRLGEGESQALYGSDSMLTMNDDVYTGTDDNEPVNRTGIYALKNVTDLSLIAAPGQTSGAVQQALIDQCESLLYRFAVLDAQGPADDTIDDVQTQRQNFDTKYAALYHPWLTIPDPFPTNLASIGQFPIPPSGHVLGIYARVDDQRGVHKAPANEVINGMSGLTRYLNQGEQDLLNAYPVNIDVIRDFRPNSRGIRVWGARCITSDSDWKYVNVRRLLIFIEDSLNQGLQWVVFEPNAEELWGRVRRTVSNFLTTVWRNGALEGDTKDQGFYVKCDRTTMTEDDLDNGRLIVVIGVAPVKPAEFVIIRIGLWTADASS